MAFYPALSQGVGAYLIDWRELIFVFGGFLEQPFAVGSIDEFAFVVKEFQSVPLFGVVLRREYHAAVSFQLGDSYLGRRSGAQPDVDNVGTHSLQVTTDQLVNHCS